MTSFLIRLVLFFSLHVLNVLAFTLSPAWLKGERQQKVTICFWVEGVLYPDQWTPSTTIFFYFFFIFDSQKV